MILPASKNRYDVGHTVPVALSLDDLARSQFSHEGTKARRKTS
jgi:hypothetical protein